LTVVAVEFDGGVIAALCFGCISRRAQFRFETVSDREILVTGVQSREAHFAHEPENREMRIATRRMELSFCFHIARRRASPRQVL
jgi:hypothetical protein